MRRGEEEERGEERRGEEMRRGGERVDMRKVKETIYRCCSMSLCEVLLWPCHINLSGKTKKEEQ